MLELSLSKFHWTAPTEANKPLQLRWSSTQGNLVCTIESCQSAMTSTNAPQVLRVVQLGQSLV
jgi:hypothetical protein